MQTVIYSVEVTRRAYHLVSELRRNGVRDFRVLTPPTDANATGLDSSPSFDAAPTGSARMPELTSDLAALVQAALQRGRAVVVVSIDPANRAAVNRLVTMCCPTAETIEPPMAMAPPAPDAMGAEVVAVPDSP